MNPTLYQQLSPLGFAEWLEKIHNEPFTSEEFSRIDSFAINSCQRTVMNALAFRWLREEKDIFFRPIQCTQGKFKYGFEYEIGNEPKTREYGDVFEYHVIYELAEHEALNKALEILSKGGENGMD